MNILPNSLHSQTQVIVCQLDTVFARRCSVIPYQLLWLTTLVILALCFSTFLWWVFANYHDKNSAMPIYYATVADVLLALYYAANIVSWSNVNRWSLLLLWIAALEIFLMYCVILALRSYFCRELSGENESEATCQTGTSHA